MIYQLSSDGTEYALISYADVDEIVDPTILSEINGIPVKSVRINAFNGFQHVKGTLTIPSSIETIGDCAFSGTDIEAVIFEEGSPVTELPASTFSSCQFLKEVKLPEGLEIINMYAFAQCWDLEFIEIPASINNIYMWAFQNSGVKHVQINSDNVDMFMNKLAFTGCADVTLYFPNIPDEIPDGDWNYPECVINVNWGDPYTPAP